jgi:UDP-N-acetylmuramate--alanine ligase
MDELILLPIYPAREEPIPGVTSEILLGGDNAPIREQVVEKKDLVAELKQRVERATEPVVILTVGAGDIDRLVPEIERELKGERMD